MKISTDLTLVLIDGAESTVSDIVQAVVEFLDGEQIMVTCDSVYGIDAVDVKATAS